MNKHRTISQILACVAVLLAVDGSVAVDRLDLAGQWRFQIDPGDKGISNAWYESRLGDPIRLPGSLQEQGYGDIPSADTQWTGGIVDRSFFESARYKPYPPRDG